MLSYLLLFKFQHGDNCLVLRVHGLASGKTMGVSAPKEKLLPPLCGFLQPPSKLYNFLAYLSRGTTYGQDNP